MRRPLLVYPETAKLARKLAATMGREVKPADVLGLAMLTTTTMLDQIARGGLGNVPIRGADLLGLHCQAVNLSAARAARNPEIEA